MKPTILLNPQQASLYNEQLIGGKAQQLATLTREGFSVPAWCVISTAAFDLQMEMLGLSDAIAALAQTQKLDLQQWQTRRQQIIDTPLNTRLCEHIDQAIQALITSSTQNTTATPFFAIRSSAVGEDSATASFAGQMDSFLFQHSKQSIYASVARCFASAFSERALLYRQQHHCLEQTIRCAVIIQTMVDAEVSGVLFTANPATGQRDEAVISACYGLGEGIVSGACITDEFIVDIQSADIKQAQINAKDQKIIFDHKQGQGVTTQSISPEQQNQACLSDKQLEQLMKVGTQIAQHYACPQDIEWCWNNDTLFILQTRPITSLPYPQTRNGKRIIWDNSNIEESYCGVCLPLTLSFARHAYETVYQQTMQTFGFKAETVQAEQHAFAHMIGFIQGRTYYNINHWYQGLAYFPFMDMNKADMERMMGLQDPVDFVVDRHLSTWQKAKKIPSLALTFMRLMQRFRTLNKQITAFQQYFARVYTSVQREQLHTLQLSELHELTQRLRKDLLENWQVPIYNDLYVMMMNGKVRRTLEKTGIDDVTALQNNLLAGEQGIESTEPTKVLLAITKQLRHKPSLCKRLQQQAKTQWLAILQQEDQALYQDCLAYIENYGDRCIGEQKFETITVRQNSEFMFTVIDNYLQQADLSLDKLKQGEQTVRQQAERRAFKLIQDKLGKYALQRFKRHLARFRQGVKNRENMRMNRSRMFGLFRSIYIEMGKQLAVYHILKQPSDIFYLSTQELSDYFNGVSIQTNFQGLVALRQTEYAAHQHQQPPNHFETQGMIYHHTDYQYHGDLKIDVNATQLQGTGCYSGEVTGTVRVIYNPNEEKSLQGKILCTKRTDPGWAPLFPSCSGILVERGSTLSHSAVVARELGIPAIVGIPGLTQILRDGDRVTLNGGSGKIVIHSDVETDRTVDEALSEDAL